MNERGGADAQLMELYNKNAVPGPGYGNNLLNTRPRKRLNYRTPAELFEAR